MEKLLIVRRQSVVKTSLRRLMQGVQPLWETGGKKSIKMMFCLFLFNINTQTSLVGSTPLPASRGSSIKQVFLVFFPYDPPLVAVVCGVVILAAELFLSVI